MNDSRTCTQSGAKLTHDVPEVFPMTDFTETRSMLKKLAMAHGADTPIGHACHNLLEMTESYSKEIGSDQRQQLRSNIEREKTRLNLLINQAH
jgi:hypothetical protein